MGSIFDFFISGQGIGILYLLNVALAIAIIFAERKTPSATLAWVMFLAFIPILGFFFYFILNQNISRSKINRLTENEEYFISGALKSQMKEMENDTFVFHSDVAPKWKSLIKLNQVYANAYYTEKNNVELLTDGNELRKRLYQDIRQAKETINVEFFIIKRDYVGLDFIDLLTKKAREGITVRLLIDSLGSRFINDRVLKDYIQAGGKVGYFFKPKLKIFGVKINYRNHRKIVVIDDKIAYTGGYNIAKEYIGKKKKFGYWRDSHLRITGEGVIDLNARFTLDWRFTTKEKLDVLKVAHVSDDIDHPVGMQIVSCGPESHKEEVKRAYMKMITSARKNVFIQTPYFVPDQSIIESLKMATQSGVDVRVMIPCKPDHVLVYWATYSYVGDLIKSGVRVFIYDNGFLHAKTMVCDGEVGTVGSTNFDNRSFRLNFESNAVIYDKDFAEKMEDVFGRDMEKCHELTLDAYNKRSLIIRIKEPISRLFSDVM